MTKWYFVKNWERTGQGYTPAELAEMLLQKKIRRNRNVLSDDDTGSDVGGVIAEAYCELWDKCLSVRQRAYLRFLGYRGTLYLPQDVGSELIEKIREAQEYKDRDEKGFNKYVSAAEKEDGEYVAEVLQRHYHGGAFAARLAYRGELQHLIAATVENEFLKQYEEEQKRKEEERQRKIEAWQREVERKIDRDRETRRQQEIEWQKWWIERRQDLRRIKEFTDPILPYSPIVILVTIVLGILFWLATLMF